MKDKERRIVAILNDIRSLHNVGSMFRTADAAAVAHMYLCGYTSSPVDRFGRKRKEIAKTALGAEESIPWSVHPDLAPLLSELKKEGYQIVMLESGSEKGSPYDEVVYDKNVALVVGNEVEGIPKNILSQADVVVEIPLLGGKESLNVSVAFGIGVYGVRLAAKH
jgi:tRNA G18 (ribose-2'-O)-methylase SpoU